MKILKSKLKQIIKEELSKLLSERIVVLPDGTRVPADSPAGQAALKPPEGYRPGAQDVSFQPGAGQQQSAGVPGVDYNPYDQASEQGLADQADADVAAAKSVAAARREFAKARRDLKQYLKKNGGPYASIYKMPKDSTPAGRARKRFAAAYSKLRKLKKARLGKAMGSKKNLSPEDKIRRKNLINKRVDKGASIHGSDVPGGEAVKGAAEASEVEANQASLNILKKNLAGAKKRGDKAQVAKIQQQIKKAQARGKDLKKRADVFGKMGTERVGGGPASAVVSPQAKKQIEAVRSERQKLAAQLQKGGSEGMKQALNNKIKKLAKQEADLIKKHMKK